MGSGTQVSLFSPLCFVLAGLPHRKFLHAPAHFISWTPVSWVLVALRVGLRHAIGPHPYALESSLLSAIVTETRYAGGAAAWPMDHHEPTCAEQPCGVTLHRAAAARGCHGIWTSRSCRIDKTSLPRWNSNTCKCRASGGCHLTCRTLHKPALNPKPIISLSLPPRALNRLDSKQWLRWHGIARALSNDTGINSHFNSPGAYAFKQLLR